MADKKYLVYLSALVSAIFAYCEVFHVELTNDTNYFMHCALRLWQFGTSQLYERCVDENAPFHELLYAPLAGLAAGMHLEASYVLHGFCVLLCLMSLFVIAHVLKKHEVLPEERSLWLAGTAFIFLAVPSIYGVFADREHLLFIFAMPWIIQMLIRVRPLNYTCVLAAFGFCMKPHDYVLFALLALTGGPLAWSLRQRIFSASSWIIGSFGACYVAVIFWLFPQYIFDMLPLSAVIYPSKYYPFSYKFGFSLKYLVITCFCIFTFVMPPSMMLPWFAFIFGGAIVLLLNAGWDYTFYLVCVPMLLALITPWFPRYGKRAEADPRLVKSVKMLLGIMLFICSFSICTEMGTLATPRFRNHNTIIPPLRHELQEAAGDKFIMLSIHIWNTEIEPFNAAPVAVFGYDNIWTYPWLVQNPNDPHYSKVLHLFTTPFSKVLNENPTTVILEDVSPGTRISQAGIIGFFKEADPDADKAMEHYKVMKIIDFCAEHFRTSCRFNVWKRQEE